MSDLSRRDFLKTTGTGLLVSAIVTTKAPSALIPGENSAFGHQYARPVASSGRISHGLFRQMAFGENPVGTAGWDEEVGITQSKVVPDQAIAKQAGLFTSLKERH